jgi:uncharacterized OB-fold protein
MEPPADETSAPFWEATRERRLLVQWCASCGHPVFFPREVCPFCTSSQLEWRPASGRATLYSFTVEHKPQVQVLASTGPYAIALVDLDEGVRMMSNVVRCEVESLVVGMALQVTWEPLSDGRHLPLFEPRDGAPLPGAGE